MFKNFNIEELSDSIQKKTIIKWFIFEWMFGLYRIWKISSKGFEYHVVNVFGI